MSAGEKMSADAVLRMLHRLGEYAGVPNVHTHRFRHTFAAEFTERNRDPLATMRRLGHSTINTTMGYLHSLGADYGTGADYETPGEWLK